MRRQARRLQRPPGDRSAGSIGDPIEGLYLVKGLSRSRSQIHVTGEFGLAGKVFVLTDGWNFREVRADGRDSALGADRGNLELDQVPVDGRV